MGNRQNLNRSQKGIVVRAITVRDRAAGAAGLTLSDVPHPHAAENDVIVRVHAAGFTPGELDWPGTWTDRAGRDRTPSVPGHELSGVVSELGYGTTGLTVGQRVFGLADWTRDGALAEYTAASGPWRCNSREGVARGRSRWSRAGGTLVTIIGLPQVRPADGRAIFFVVDAGPAPAGGPAGRVRSWRLRAGHREPYGPGRGTVRVHARRTGRPASTIIRVAEGAVRRKAST